jgi:hypothetical protein
MPQHEAGTIVAQLIQMGIPLSKKECCCPGCGATRGMRGMLFGIASGTNGVIVLMTGMSFRAFVGVSGSISAIMSPTVEDCLIWASKKSHRNILHDDNKTLSRGV